MRLIRSCPALSRDFWGKNSEEEGGEGRWRGERGVQGRRQACDSDESARWMSFGSLTRLKKHEKGRALSYHPPLHANLVAPVGWLSLNADRRTLIE
jgi:hypothetical protein